MIHSLISDLEKLTPPQDEAIEDENLPFMVQCLKV